ncbi:hypothetical protein ACC691_36870, partial [Rhizobium johnstonii]|uniref:hypothetical protein n=1 Tax=Rhizobium johnstonii TaxID=3019933 RepID=UPI003F974EF4
ALQLDIITDGGTMLLDTQRTFFYRRHGDSVSSWTAADGTRFREEKELFREAEASMLRRGWKRAAAAAHHHVSSRLNAITRIPSAIASRDSAGTRSLLAHSLGVHRTPAIRSHQAPRR